MITFSLQSGSNGNCIYVETGDARLLIDAGISGKCAHDRLAALGRDIRRVNALLISHNHSDHVKGAGIIHRRYHLPVYVAPRTWQACRGLVGQVNQLRHFEPGAALTFGQTVVWTVPTPHDGVDGVAFMISHQDKTLGVFTDLGHCFSGIEDCLKGLDAVYLESNYDPDMLSQGPYPPWLQARITGAGGHISNGEAAELLAVCNQRMQWAVLSHISEHNNTPELALATVRSKVDQTFPLHVASRYGTSDIFQVM